MKNNLTKFAAMAFTALTVMATMNACKDEQAVEPAATPNNEVSVIKHIGPVGATECTVTYLTGADLTWFSTFDPAGVQIGKTILLHGDVRVGAGKTLTISKHTLIKGEKASKGTLTIERGAKISAVGTFDEPIVFTSDQNAGSRAARDWGGILIMGEGISNKGVNQTPEGYPACVTKPTYGGTNNADNSGKMSFVRIEFAGVPVTTGDEKNSLSLYAVGSGTKIDHIQCSFGADDSFEWFGGAVNMSYLISYRGGDDDFDTDNGYSGQVQYGIAFRDPAVADNSTSNGFESDNDATGSGALPQTSAVFSNFTLVGPYDPNCTRVVVNTPGTAVFGDGLHLRRNTGIDVHNTIITGWPLRQTFLNSVTPPTNVLLSSNTAVRHAVSVPASLCFSEPVAPNNAWTANATNLCNDATVCTASEAAGTGMQKKSGLKNAAWDLSLVNPIYPSVQELQNHISTKNGVNATAFGSYFVANTTNGLVSDTTYFRGAQRFAGDNGWRTGKKWINYDPQNTVYPN